MSASIERRLQRLEVAAHASEPPRLFVRVIGREVTGFAAMAAAAVVQRLEGETVEELELRCAALQPGVVVWRTT